MPGRKIRFKPPKRTLLVGAAALFAAGVTLVARTPGSQATASSLTWLRVDGNRLLDDAGNPVVLRGANVESREWLWSSSKSIEYEQRAIPMLTGKDPSGWKANLVLLAFASGPVNRGESDYLAALDDLVALAKGNGAYTLLVYRYAEPNTGQPSMPDQAAEEAIARLAARYENEPAVIYGLQVEPHDVTWAQLKPRFTSMVDAIRTGNPKAVIVVPGTQWGRYIYHALTDPIPRTGLIYKTHPYDSFSTIQGKYRLPEVSSKYPVMLGEFGTGSMMSQGDVDQLLDLAETNGISWAAWIFHKSACPCLLTDTASFATTAYGGGIRQRLETAWSAGSSTPPEPPTPAPAPTSSPAPSPSPTAAATHSISYMVYDDILRWQNWSWNSEVDPEVPAPAYAGQTSLGVTFNGAWAGLYLASPAVFDTSPFTAFTFMIRPGGQALSAISLSFYAESRTELTGTVRLSAYSTLVEDGWYRVVIPLTDVNANQRLISGVQLQDATGAAQPTFHVDIVQFVGETLVAPAESPTPASAPETPTPAQTATPEPQDSPTPTPLATIAATVAVPTPTAVPTEAPVITPTPAPTTAPAPSPTPALVYAPEASPEPVPIPAATQDPQPTATQARPSIVTQDSPVPATQAPPAIATPGPVDAPALTSTPAFTPTPITVPQRDDSPTAVPDRGRQSEAGQERGLQLHEARELPPEATSTAVPALGSSANSAWRPFEANRALDDVLHSRSSLQPAANQGVLETTSNTRKSFTFSPAWTGLYLNRAGVSLKRDSALSFMINPGGSELANLELCVYEGTFYIQSVRISDFAMRRPGGCYLVEIPLGALIQSAKTITRVQVQDTGGRMSRGLMVEQMKLLSP